LRRPTRAYSPN
jgi:hypothetical protein